MSEQPEPSRLQALFQAALEDYEEQTGIALAKHPLAEQLDYRPGTFLDVDWLMSLNPAHMPVGSSNLITVKND
jgi:hypothetical protein